MRALVPLPNELAATLAPLGVDQSNRIVCYAAGKSMWPSRAYWVLRYYGFPRVHLADRSLAALQRAEDGLGEPRNSDDGLRAFSWEKQGELLEDVLTRAANRPGL